MNYWNLSRGRHCRLGDRSRTAQARRKRYGHADGPPFGRRKRGIAHHAMAFAGGVGEIRASQDHDVSVPTLNGACILQMDRSLRDAGAGDAERVCDGFLCQIEPVGMQAVSHEQEPPTDTLKYRVEVVTHDALRHFSE